MENGWGVYYIKIHGRRLHVEGGRRRENGRQERSARCLKFTFAYFNVRRRGGEGMRGGSGGSKKKAVETVMREEESPNIHGRQKVDCPILKYTTKLSMREKELRGRDARREESSKICNLINHVWLGAGVAKEILAKPFRCVGCVWRETSTWDQKDKCRRGHGLATKSSTPRKDVPGKRIPCPPWRRAE